MNWAIWITGLLVERLQQIAASDSGTKEPSHASA